MDAPHREQIDADVRAWQRQGVSNTGDPATLTMSASEWLQIGVASDPMLLVADAMMSWLLEQKNTLADAG